MNMNLMNAYIVLNAEVAGRPFIRLSEMEMEMEMGNGKLEMGNEKWEMGGGTSERELEIGMVSNLQGEKVTYL